MHDIFFFTYPTKMHPVKLFLAKHLLKKAAQLSHTVITSSHFSKNAICKYTKVPESKVQVIPLAINRSVFSPSNNTPYARKVLSEIYQVKKNFFLCVGRIADHKNQRLLCKAFIRLQLLGIKNIELVFIGKYQNCLEQQYKKKQLLEEFVEINEHMRFIGPISEEHLAYFYQSAECMVFPSMHEGFGLPPLEAMSSGCPCIVSNVTSIPEVCKDGALYFNSNDVDDLVRVVIDFLQHPKQRKEIIIRGLVQSQSFCWQNTSQQYISAIDRLISI
jgi:glycosyltransferase involved in cell wall biosynthesis